MDFSGATSNLQQRMAASSAGCDEPPREGAEAVGGTNEYFIPPFGGTTNVLYRMIGITNLLDHNALV